LASALHRRPPGGAPGTVLHAQCGCFGRLEQLFSVHSKNGSSTFRAAGLLHRRSRTDLGIFAVRGCWHARHVRRPLVKAPVPHLGTRRRALSRCSQVRAPSRRVHSSRSHAPLHTALRGTREKEPGAQHVGDAWPGRCLFHVAYMLRWGDGVRTHRTAGGRAHHIHNATTKCGR
jgi:hypothetical protein